jgi:hypothetical protein
MKRIATTLALVLAAAWTVQANAATITFTGSETDFTSQGIVPIQDDGLDTQSFGGGCEQPLDIGKVYITNDLTNLYIGMQYKRQCFCDINLFWAFDVRPGGSVGDPFCRAIDWSLAPGAPDFYVYDVVPTGCNGFNYEVMYEANGSGGWNNLGDGPNGRGIVDTDGGDFVEIAIPLSTMGLGCQPTSLTDVRFEIGVTQEGCTKPAFELVASDPEQRSTVGGTCFDIGPCNPSAPREYLHYRIDCPVPSVGKSWGSVKNQYR